MRLRRWLGRRLPGACLLALPKCLSKKSPCTSSPAASSAIRARICLSARFLAARFGSFSSLIVHPFCSAKAACSKLLLSALLFVFFFFSGDQGSTARAKAWAALPSFYFAVSKHSAATGAQRIHQPSCTPASPVGSAALGSSPTASWS